MSPIVSQRELGPDEFFEGERGGPGTRRRRPAAPPTHGMISVGAGALIAILFFLPWIDIQCSGNSISTPSGFHIATGKVDSTLKEFKASMDNMGRGFQGTGAGTPGEGGGPALGASSGPGQDEDLAKLENRSPRHQVWAVAFFGALALIGGVVTLKTGGATGVSPGALIALGVCGAGLLGFEVSQNFGYEIPKDQPVPMITSAPTAWLYLEFVAFGALILGGLTTRGKRKPEPGREWASGPDRVT